MLVGRAGGPVVDVVDLTPVAGRGAARMGAATILGVQHNPLPGRGGAAAATEIQRDLAVPVEDHQIVTLCRSKITR